MGDRARHRSACWAPGQARGNRSVVAGIRSCDGRCRLQQDDVTAGRRWRRVLVLTVGAALVMALAPGCGLLPAPHANAADAGPRIDKGTPPGLRAQQTMDMLNSDWPIGPVGVGTLAAPDKVDSVEATMEALWWDRPFTLDHVDISASVATLHLISSYGARQNIRIHTDDDGRVDRFDLDTQPPPINSWHDVDAVLSRTGARYSTRSPRSNRVAVSRLWAPTPRISAAGIDFQVVRAARRGGCSPQRNGFLGRSADRHRQGQSRWFFRFATAARGTRFGSHSRRKDDRHQR